MLCPVCNEIRMREIEKNGVLIDTCPECKGIWLDRGELDKIMRNMKEIETEYTSEREYEPKQREHPDPYNPYHKKKKKKTVLDSLGDLFDF